MYKLLLWFGAMSAAFAEEKAFLDTYQKEIALTALAIAILLIVLFVAQRKELKEAEALIKEKDEKIAWLRQIHAQNEHRLTQKIQELEKESMQQNHKIDKLETKLKEGTKNQVVAKIEELRAKREAARRRHES